jgi:hypothetical protein
VASMLGVGEIGERGFDGRQVRIHGPIMARAVEPTTLGEAAFDPEADVYVADTRTAPTAGGAAGEARCDRQVRERCR